MKQFLREYYLKQQFEPGFLGLFINPFYIARKGLYTNIKILANEIQGLTLDVGCGNKPYEHLFDVSKYIGLDLITSIHNVHAFADIFFNGKHLPIKDDIIDTVICNQVLEHVFEPDMFLAEINRVLKNNGIILISLPFVWDEHEQPYDYARYSSFGIKYLLQKHGFSINLHIRTVNDFSLFAQLLNLYIYKLVYKKKGFVKKCVTLFVMAPITIFGVLLGKILPKNNDLFLDSIILAKKNNSKN